MSKEKRRVPKLRFPGFTEDWEQRKLGDFTNQINNFVNPEDAKLPLWSLTAEAGLIEKSDRYERDFLVKKKDQFKRIETNTLVYNPMNITIGSIDIYTGLYPIAVSGYYVSIVYDKNIDTDFLKEVLLLPSSLKMYKNYATGSLIERQRVQYPTFSKLQLLLPNLDEQKAIGQFFKSLNLDITLHQRKLDNLKLKKKALLQKLFPKNGDRYPELRFPGFTDAWEQRKLSDITYLSGIKNKENKPYESYSISNEFGFIPQAEQFENGGTMQTADKSMYYIVSQNSFAYNPARINVGSIGYYDKPDNVIVSSLYEVFKTTDIVNDKFLWHWFKSNQFNRLIGKYQEGGVRLYFYYDKLCKGTMGLPAINEQNKISNLLDDLDMYITLHQRKLDHLQLQKKALLQQIFV